MVDVTGIAGDDMDMAVHYDMAGDECLLLCCILAKKFI